MQLGCAQETYSSLVGRGIGLDARYRASRFCEGQGRRSGRASGGEGQGGQADGPDRRKRAGGAVAGSTLLHH